jgi:hypothetical protein
MLRDSKGNETGRKQGKRECSCRYTWPRKLHSPRKHRNRKNDADAGEGRGGCATLPGHRACGERECLMSVYEMIRG